MELPLKDPDAFRRLGIRPAKGFPALRSAGHRQDLARQGGGARGGGDFIATKSSDLLSKWYGESEQQITRLFQRARQSRLA